MDAWQPGVTASEGDHQIPKQVVELANQLMKAPDIWHSLRGMVLTEDPVSRVCPVEPARMEGRTVLQWDRTPARRWVVKFDLLGLGILSAISHTFRLVEDHFGEVWLLASIPRRSRACSTCCAGPTRSGQVESHAQVGTLLRLRPRSFYDLTIACVQAAPPAGGSGPRER
jgi:error-prone DNA polymerase